MSLTVVIAFSAITASLGAQKSPVQQIEMAAAGYARSLYLSGTVVFDPRPAYEKGTAPSRTPAEISALAKAIGATKTADQAEYLVCSGTPRRCIIKGADAIVYIDRPEVIGDTAYVIVGRLQPFGSPRMPISGREDRLLFVKTGAAWKFVKLVGGGRIT